MKEEKLFKAVRNVEDDLICEMMDYSPDLNITGEESEGVLYIVPAGVKRKRRLWRYPVMTAAMLGVMGGALFVINSNGFLSEKLIAALNGETSETFAEENGENAAETSAKASEEEAAQPEGENTIEETKSVVGEAPSLIVPIKVELAFGGTDALFVNSFPTVPQSDIGDEYFTEMSTKELFEYYGLTGFVVALENDIIVEVTDKAISHGIYFLPDGGIYDINTFTFEMSESEKSPSFANRFSVTVGKEKRFAQEYDSPLWKMYYIEEIDRVFSVEERYGCTVMFSGISEEINMGPSWDDDKPPQAHNKSFDYKSYAVSALNQIRGNLVYPGHLCGDK